MSPPPRSLTFVVSTSLLTASLSLAGCDEQPANSGPVKGSQDKTDKGSDEDRVNEGPETPPPVISVNEGPEPVPEPPPPEPIHVNEGPEPVPEPPVIHTNTGPSNEPSELIEPKRVNTRPEP
jgi:hypothetical protein